MLALVGAIIFAVHAFGGDVEDVHLPSLAGMFVALHFVVGEWSPWRRPQ